MEIKKQKLVDVKVFNSSSSAGFGTPFSDGEELRKVDYEYVKNVKNPYLIAVSGNSMSPLINDGDEVVFDGSQNVRSGQIAVVNYNGDLLIKEYLETSEGYVLRSKNPLFPDITVGIDDTFHVSGRVATIIKHI